MLPQKLPPCLDSISSMGQVPGGAGGARPREAQGLRLPGGRGGFILADACLGPAPVGLCPRHAFFLPARTLPQTLPQTQQSPGFRARAFAYRPRPTVNNMKGSLMIPEDLTPMQPPNTSAPPRGPCCPWCLRPYFDLRTSAALDFVALAQAVLSDLAKALEAEVLP